MNKIIGTTITLFALIIALGLYSNSQKPESVSLEKSETFVLQDSDHVAGNPDSSVVLIEYSDLQCPACGAYYPLVEELKKTYGDRVAFVTRDFPLHFHLQARDAAKAAEAAANQGKYEEMKGLIFGNQRVWSGNADAKNIFASYAESLELDMELFETDRASAEVEAQIDYDFAAGQAAGVNSTPTFFLNGEKIQPRSIEEFGSLFNTELGQVEGA